MRTIRRLRAMLGVKGFLCLASWIMIALALVSYTADVSIIPTQQFTLGATSDSWTVYVNDVDKVRYLPGGFGEPTFNASDINTYAFKVVTDGNQVCAVKIELTSVVNSSKFSKFQITVKYWDNAVWSNETLYQNPTNNTTKAYIDGLTSGDVGYIHQSLSVTKWYLICVLYSYDQTDETTQVTVTFKYTPLPQDSF
jgi:hypothetical protein